MKQIATPFSIKPKRPPTAFVCGKCLKKCDHGRRIRKALKAELTARAQATRQRPHKLVETKCMGLCPKQAVVVASGTVVLRGELLLLKAADDAAPAVDLLLGSSDRTGREQSIDSAAPSETAANTIRTLQRIGDRNAP